MITLKNVTKRYGRVNALRAVSLTVEGKSVAVLGEKGAGKTALAGIFCGITAPSKGSATVDGLQLTSREAAERIGYVPEKCQLSPSLTLVESMSFAAELRGLDENAVGKALDEADMNNGLARVPVGMLGSAALKRASLAFALLGSPEYVVLDQPIQGLGEEDEAEMLTVLEGLSQRYALIYFSDTLDDARALCDRVALLSNGKIVVYDSFDAVISPKTETVGYKIRARGDADALKAALSESEAIVKYQVSVTASGTSVIELTVNAPENAENAVRAILADAGQKIIELKKADSPVERILSRLYDNQDAKEEERRLRREEKAAPVKLTELLRDGSFTDSEETAEDVPKNSEDAVNPPKTDADKSSDSELLRFLEARDEDGTEDNGDAGGEGESTLF